MKRASLPLQRRQFLATVGAGAIIMVLRSRASAQAKQISIGFLAAAGDGEIVNFHCLVDPALKVADVHDKVDEVERALRLRFPSIKRAIGHAEPAAP